MRYLAITSTLEELHFKHRVLILYMTSFSISPSRWIIGPKFRKLSLLGISYPFIYLFFIFDFWLKLHLIYFVIALLILNLVDFKVSLHTSIIASNLLHSHRPTISSTNIIYHGTFSWICLVIISITVASKGLMSILDLSRW